MINASIIDDKNMLVYEDASYDGAPLSKTANKIIKFVAEDKESAQTILASFEKSCKDIEYTSTRIDSRDIHITKALGSMGYHMTEIVMKVTGVLSKLEIDDTQFSKFTFEEATQNDYLTIGEYAIKFFNHGKFHEDPLIDRPSADVRNLNMVVDLTKKYSTYVGRVNGNIIGFMILNHEDTVVDLLLGGMHSDYRHLSYSFWNRVFSEFKDKGVKKFTTTISAANIPVVNLYSRFGFKFSEALYGFRKFR